MKKILLTAAIVMTVISSYAQGITTKSDSLSYAAGMSMTEGLIPYLKQNLNVDTAYLSDFAKGFQEAMKKATDKKFAAHAAGYQIAVLAQQRMLPGLKEQLDGTGLNLNEELFIKGFVASLMKDYSVFTASGAQNHFGRNMDELKAAKEEKLYGPNRKAGEDFLAANAKNPDVTVLPSGLQYKVLTKGTGEVPTINDEVIVKYEGKLIDGTVFDSSYERKEQTNKFRPSQVIPGWTEALTLMPVGSKWQIFIPQQLAYGSREAGKIKPFSALIFTVELVDIVKAK